MIYFLLLETFSTLQTYSLSFGVAEISGYRFPFITFPLCWTQKLPRTHLMSRTSLYPSPSCDNPAKEVRLCSVNLPSNIRYDEYTWFLPRFADSTGSSVHPTPALNFRTTSDLLTQRPKSSEVLTMELSASALWQWTGAHFFSCITLACKYTEGDQGNWDLSASADSRVAACRCPCAALWLIFVASDF